MSGKCESLVMGKAWIRHNAVAYFSSRKVKCWKMDEERERESAEDRERNVEEWMTEWKKERGRYRK